MRIVAQITAAFILALAVIGIIFGAPLGVEISPEGYTALGMLTGIAGTFLFLAQTKSNGTLVTKGGG